MIRLLNGDCLEVLAGMAPESIDACVTDPPYHLLSTVERFAKTGGADRKHDGNNQYGRLSRGFMGKTWDGGDIAFRPETWAAVLRVLKPGAHLVAFGASKNYHRLACAIEDAGFEIRDSLMWIFGSGFPKSHDVAKGIDKAAGAEREVIAQGAPVKRMIPGADQNKVGWEKNNGRVYVPTETAPATEEAARWEGWGTALKPAYEPIILARKPLIGTVAQNVMKHGTGAINIDATRVEGVKPEVKNIRFDKWREMEGREDRQTPEQTYDASQGRWPANVVHDGSDEVLAGFPNAPGQIADASSSSDSRKTQNVYGTMKRGNGREGEASADSENDGAVGFKMKPGARRGDTGSAARFFYCAKASAKDRAGSKHPTVKPVALMRWLCRLVTPPGGLILDPFAGSGTTGQAAQEEGFDAILIEREAEYQADIRRRLGLLPAEIEEALA